MAHKASTQSRQPSLSAAAICTSLRFFHPAFSLSLSAVLLHVVLGLPRFRRPSGAQVNAVLQSLFGSFLMMWQMKTELSSAVRRFFVEARKVEGKPYSRTTIKTIRVGLDWFLSCSPHRPHRKTFSIIRDK